MLDTQTPGQMLAGQPQAPPQQVGNTPLAQRLAQDPSSPPPAPQQQQQQQPAPTPQQQATAARHHAIGKAATFLFGQQRDENGEPIKQRPGDVFKSLLMGAMLGSSLASEGHAGGGSVGGFLSGVGRGASGVEQQNYARQQQAEANSQKKQELSLEQQKFKEEQTLHAVTLEHWNIEQLAHGREADYRDREQLDKENEQDESIQKWAIENGAYPAPNIPHNGEPNNGPDLMKSMVNDPNRFNPPPGMGRLIVKKYSFEGLDHDAKNGWTQDGKPVDWSKHLTWTVMYAPSNPTDKTPISMKASEWASKYGVKFPDGTDPDATFSVKAVGPLVSVATQDRKQNREDSNQAFKERHDALSATINAARTNVTQLNSEKRELLRQGYGESDNEVKDINGKIADEQAREQEAIDQMHPKVRERVKAQTPTAAPPGKPNNSSNTQQTFSVGAWKKANPRGDVNAAKAEAKKRGYNVVD